MGNFPPCKAFENSQNRERISISRELGARSTLRTQRSNLGRRRHAPTHCAASRVLTSRADGDHTTGLASASKDYLVEAWIASLRSQ